jgi:uncharacterized cupin superfamily protein
MKVFVFQHSESGERELFGEYEMAQIPHVGERLLVRRGGDVASFPIVAVRHFITDQSGEHGAFLTVGAIELDDRDSQIAALFSE